MSFAITSITTAVSAGVAPASSFATGGSFVFATVMVKMSAALARDVSVAVTSTEITPTSSLSGVPENSLVAGSKESHVGNIEPPSSVAE